MYKTLSMAASLWYLAVIHPFVSPMCICIELVITPPPPIWSHFADSGSISADIGNLEGCSLFREIEQLPLDQNK